MQLYSYHHEIPRNKFTIVYDAELNW